MEKILICMPTYHSPEIWLTRAINSVLAQTYSNFECWIVKDGCKQACTFKPNYTEQTCLECDLCKQTEKFCKEITKNDSRFKFYSMPINFGAAGWGPRNFAIMNTDCKFIAYLDDDNWYEPNHLESLYEIINQNKSDMAYTGTRLFDENGLFLKERLHPYLPKAGYIDTSEILHRKELISKFGGWRYVQKCNDWDIVNRWIPHITWSHTNKITLNFYVRKNCGIHRI